MKSSFTTPVFKRITLIILSLLALVFAYQVANSSSTDNVVGWAWAGNAESWISLNNCDSSSACSGPDYGLKIDFATGELSGYIWSDNYGFISFNRSMTNNPPAAPFNGGSGPIASYDSATGQITGWARALAGCQTTAGSPAISCGSTSAGANAGGWDGWIKLSGTATDGSAYGLSYSTATNKITGYAWGGSEVLGWISFTDANVLPLPVITFTATPSSINSGQTSSLTWSVTGATSCTASDSWTGAKSIGGGTESTGVLTVTKTYRLSCTGAGGTAVKDVTVTVSSALTDGSGSTLNSTDCEIAVGESTCDVTVDWSANNFVGEASVLQDGEEISSGVDSGSQNRSISEGETTFTLNDVGGTYTNSVTSLAQCASGSTWNGSSCAADVVAPTEAPKVTISAKPNLVRSGSTATIEITIDSAYAVSCIMKGLPEATLDHNGAVTQLQIHTFSTRSLTSAQIVSVSCNYVDYNFPTGEITTRVNVIPATQEI